MDDSFSAALKGARKARGWTQEDLAKQLGVSQQSVQKWEAGTSLPRTVRREALMKALGLHAQRQQQIDRIMHGTDKREAVVVVDRKFIEERRHLPGAVRVQAFIAAIDQALPPEYQQFLEPPRVPGFRFATDYLSGKLAMEITQPLLKFANMRMEHHLWNLATLRQVDLQMVGKARQYVVALIADDLEAALRIASRWGMESQLHGIRIETVQTPEAVADLIVAYETGARTTVDVETPIDAWDESGALTPDGPDIP